MLFPLAILAALGLRHAPRPLAARWALARRRLPVGRRGFAHGPRGVVRFRVAEPERAAFLESVADVTSWRTRAAAPAAPAELPPTLAASSSRRC
jgi:hypothetical protein